MTSQTTEEVEKGNISSPSAPLICSSSSACCDEDIATNQSNDLNCSLSSEIIRNDDGAVPTADPKDEADQDSSSRQRQDSAAAPTMTICVMEDQKGKLDDPPTKNGNNGSHLLPNTTTKDGKGQPSTAEKKKRSTAYHPSSSSKDGGNKGSAKLNSSHPIGTDCDDENDVDPFLNDVQPLPSGPVATTYRNYPRSPGAHAINTRAPDHVDQDNENDNDSHNEEETPVCPLTCSTDIVHEAVVWSDDDDEENNMMTRMESGMMMTEEDELRISMQLGVAQQPRGGGDPSMTFDDTTEQGKRLRMSCTSELVEAKILPDEKNNEDCNKRGQGNERKHTLCGWLIIFFLLLAGLAVLLPLLLPSSSTSNNNGNPDTSFEQNGFFLDADDETNRSLYPPFQDDLPTAMVNFIEDPEHPHSYANTWIWEDPHRDSYSRERQIQRFHLVSFYVATNGDDWFRNDDWLSYEVNECDWFSQHHNDSIPRYDEYPVCDDENNYLVLNLASNNLQGYFPLVRNFIQTLKTYDISNNNIAGSLPSAASPDLEVFVVSNNQFEGLLVGEGNFAAWNLRVIKLDGNALYGVHEPLFMFLKSLEILDIAGNHFSGHIPKTATMCSNLTEFGIADNDFEGTIPSELSVLTKLQAIDFSGNTEITGTIPSELGLLPDLNHFDVSGTAVSGDIPTSLCIPVQAEALDLIADCDGHSMLQCCTDA